MMFPNVQTFVDFTNSTNKYLYNRSWWEIGVRCAYRLLRLPQQIQEYRAADLKIDQMEARTLALTVGVMAQVRIAHANLYEVQNRFELSEQIYQTHMQQLKAARMEVKSGGRISQLELFKMAMETAGASIERTQQLGNYYLAYYRLTNSVGVGSLDNLEKVLEDEEKNKKKDGDLEASELLVVKGGEEKDIVEIEKENSSTEPADKEEAEKKPEPEKKTEIEVKNNK
jgi:outer membrane protein TolC